MRFESGLLSVVPVPGESTSNMVRIERPFAVAHFEITYDQYDFFLKSSGYQPSAQENCVFFDAGRRRWKESDGSIATSSPGFKQTGRNPAVCVAWLDAKAYASWLSERTGRKYRLMSESEWEYVARGRSGAARPWGDNVFDACKHANIWDESFQRAHVRSGESRADYGGGFDCDDGYVHTAPVGQFADNSYGIADMIGNVWEWVEDCLNMSLEGAPIDGSAWLAGNCGIRVLRGGSWASNFHSATSTFRQFRRVTHRATNIGFRIATDL